MDWCSHHRGDIGYSTPAGWGVEMIPREIHNCKTTFVGGVNPFVQYKRQIEGSALQRKILALLEDGRPRTIQDFIAETNHDSYEYVCQTLIRMHRSGKLHRELIGRSGNRPAPTYSLKGQHAPM